MTGPFVRRANLVELRLSDAERSVLRAASVIAIDGDAGERLSYAAHPDDPAAEARYRDLVDGELDSLRRADRAVFEEVVSGVPVSPELIEAFMRVVGEARLVLAERVGIEDDGWELTEPSGDPEMALLVWLGYLQDAAVAALMPFL